MRELIKEIMRKSTERDTLERELYEMHKTNEEDINFPFTVFEIREKEADLLTIKAQIEVLIQTLGDNALKTK